MWWGCLLLSSVHSDSQASLVLLDGDGFVQEMKFLTFGQYDC